MQDLLTQRFCTPTIRSCRSMSLKTYRATASAALSRSNILLDHTSHMQLACITLIRTSHEERNRSIDAARRRTWCPVAAKMHVSSHARPGCSKTLHQISKENTIGNPFAQPFDFELSTRNPHYQSDQMHMK